MSASELQGPEIVLLLEGLDALLGAEEGSSYWSNLSDYEKERLRPYRAVRAKLRDTVRMSPYVRAGTWVEDLLRKERQATLDRYHGHLLRLVKEPKLTRERLRDEMAALYRTLKDSRQSSPDLR